MNQKIRLQQALLCEGKYDVIRLSSLFDALIVPLHGFQIYKDAAKRRWLRELTEERGLIILTDSDSAGFQLRAYLRQVLPQEGQFHVILPDVYGKERRKTQRSKEGKLGVEGMSTQVLLAAFEKAGVSLGGDGGNARGQNARELVGMPELFVDGFAGQEDAQRRYSALLKELELPERLSRKMFCRCVARQDYQTAKQKLK